VSLISSEELNQMEKQYLLLLNTIDARRYHMLCGGNYSNVELHTTCINTYSLLKASNIESIFHEFEYDNLANFNQLSQRASLLASEIEFLHSEIKQKYFNLSIDQFGWDYLNLFFIFLTSQIFTSQTNHIESLLNKRDRFNILWPNYAQDYLFDSDLAKQLIFGNFAESSKINKIYTDRDSLEEFIFTKSLSEESINALMYTETLISAPTISHDDKLALINYLGAEKNNLRTTDIQSPFWDTNIGVKKINFNTSITTNNDKKSYEASYAEILTNAFKSITNQKIPKSQIDRLIDRAKFQINFYSKIYDHLHPRRIFLTNHDGGIFGPLLSLAQTREIELNYFPHSAVQNLPLKITTNCLIHSSYKNKKINELQANSYSKEKSNNYYGKKTTFKPQGNSTAVILLNDLSEYGITKGFSNNHAKNINLIGDFLTNKGYSVIIRDKPTCPYQPIFRGLLSYEFSEKSVSLAEIASCSILCIAYESATSAMSHFTQRGVLTILASNRPQSDFEYSILPEEALICRIEDLDHLIPTNLQHQGPPPPKTNVMRSRNFSKRIST
jgi:hypothetical protein